MRAGCEPVLAMALTHPVVDIGRRYADRSCLSLSRQTKNAKKKCLTLAGKVTESPIGNHPR